MALSEKDEELLRAIVTDLVYVTKEMGPMLLYNAGYSARDWEVLRKIRVAKAAGGTRRLTKREIADHIVSATRDDEIDEVFERLVNAAGEFRRFDLSQDESVARRLVAQAQARATELAVARRRLGERLGEVRLDPVRAKREKAREELLREFESMFGASEPRSRGRALESLLDRLCKVYQIESTGPFVRDEGLEQIDGGIVVGPLAYTVECKWTTPLVGRSEVDILMKKVERSPDPNMWGLLLSIGGWAPTVERAIRLDRHTKNIILMDGEDLLAVLLGRIGLESLVVGKTHFSRFHGRSYVAASELVEWL